VGRVVLFLCNKRVGRWRRDSSLQNPGHLFRRRRRRRLGLFGDWRGAQRERMSNCWHCSLWWLVERKWDSLAHGRMGCCNSIWLVGCRCGVDWRVGCKIGRRTGYMDLGSGEVVDWKKCCWRRTMSHIQNTLTFCEGTEIVSWRSLDSGCSKTRAGSDSSHPALIAGGSIA
jgi:hypothetical protein